MAVPTVEFLFSPGSRYCYLAASQISRIEETTGARFEWRPVLGPAIRALRGRDPFEGAPVSGQYDWGHRERDARAWADYYGIPFREPPGHDFDFALLARAAVAGGRLDAAASYGGALCRAVFGSDAWPIDRAQCLRVAEETGLDGREVDQLIDDPETGAMLEETARSAFQRGAFGVPTFFLGGRMFWGNDRLVLLERALAQRAVDE